MIDPIAAAGIVDAYGAVGPYGQPQQAVAATKVAPHQIGHQYSVPTATAAVRPYSPLLVANGTMMNPAMAAMAMASSSPSYGRPESPSTATGQQLAPITSPMDLFIDFTRPDSQRTRPLLVDGKRLYVDEHYISVWSPVLRSWCIECPDRELILANVQYDHVLEMLLAIHPTYKEVDEQTVHILLPLAFDYQMDGLLHRCECFLITNKMAFLEKVWLADRFQLNRLLALLLRELRPNSHKLDLSGPRYAGLSDRVKVLLLERMHGSPAPEELPEPPVDMEHLLSPSDLNFSSVRAKTGRAYHVNPYYVSAWSSLFQDRLCNGIGSGGGDEELIYCPCSSEELKYFLMAIYPPQLRITETNIAPVLMAACKLESHGLLRKCANLLLSPLTQLSVFVRLSLLDRCRLQELLDQCLQMVQKAEHILEMSQQQTYECLSVRAKSSMMDRFAQLVQQQGGPQAWFHHSAQSTPLPSTIHYCARCKCQSSCMEITWQCPQCKTYTSPSSTQSQQQQQNNTVNGGGQHHGGAGSRQHSMESRERRSQQHGGGSAQSQMAGTQQNNAIMNNQQQQVQQPQGQRIPSTHR